MIQTILECLPEPYAHNLKEVPTTSSNIPQCIGYDPQLHRLKSEMQPIPTMSKPMGQIDSFNSYNLEQPHSQRLRPFPSVRPSWSTQDPFFIYVNALKHVGVITLSKQVTETMQLHWLMTNLGIINQGMYLQSYIPSSIGQLSIYKRYIKD